MRVVGTTSGAAALVLLLQLAGESSASALPRGSGLQARKRNWDVSTAVLSLCQVCLYECEPDDTRGDEADAKQAEKDKKVLEEVSSSSSSSADSPGAVDVEEESDDSEMSDLELAVPKAEETKFTTFEKTNKELAKKALSDDDGGKIVKGVVAQLQPKDPDDDKEKAYFATCWVRCRANNYCVIPRITKAIVKDKTVALKTRVASRNKLSRLAVDEEFPEKNAVERAYDFFKKNRIQPYSSTLRGGLLGAQLVRILINSGTGQRKAKWSGYGEETPGT